MVKIDNVNQLPHLYIETLTNKLIHIYSRDEKNIFCMQLSSDKLIDEYNIKHFDETPKCLIKYVFSYKEKYNCFVIICMFFKQRWY